MDKAEAIVALIPNVRINFLTCDITYYKKKKHRLIIKCGNYRSNHTSSHCHEEFLVLVLPNSLFLSLDCV